MINKVIAPDRDGRVDLVVCAEPSPDIAKALQSSFNIGSSLAVGGLPGNLTPEVAFAISRAQAESMAQLGERLATIQLLRDGLYRACEAYANGSITETAYAVMLSRFDDTMLTMLLGEIAGGAFGRSLAGTGGSTSGEAKATLDVERKLSETREAEAELRRAIDRQAAAQDKLDQAKNSQETDDDAAVNAAEADLEQSSKEVSEAQNDLKTKLDVALTSSATATATVAGGITPGQQDQQVANVLATMQQTYVEDLNFDALEVACVIAMDSKTTDAQLSVFGRYCKTSLLPSVQNAKTAIINAQLNGSGPDHPEPETSDTVANLAK